MYDKLRIHVDELFNSAPKTRKAKELKEEILANLIDRYKDFIDSGKSEIESFNNAISGIGDVEELINALQENDVFDYEKIQNQREKHALIIAISVGLYIISVAILILFNSFGLNDEIAVCIMLTIDAFATGLIIYSTMSRPKYVKVDDTMVEEFKEWKQQSSDQKVLLKSINSIFWPLVVAIYLLISFMFDIWEYSWIIFIIATAVLNIIRLIFDFKKS